MKTILLLTCFVVLNMTLYSQQNHLSKTLTYEDYMKKSKNQKTVGWALLGGGVAMITIGGLILFSEGIFTENEAATILPLAGTGAALCSIPFFISAGSSKRKAASLLIENQSGSFMPQNPKIIKAHPTITLRIRI